MGIIGLGRVASLLEDDPLRTKPCTHAGAYEKHPETDIVAGADIEPEARERFGKRWGVTSLYEDFRAMLDEEQLDVVSVCAYARDRAEMVLDTVRSGVRGIWCEKAIATSLEEARRMAEACERRGVATVVNHPRRWSPYYVEVRRRIERGDIGEPQAIVSCFSGNLIHTGTHAFDVMRMMLGDVAEVRGRLDESSTAEGEDVSGFEPGECDDLEDFGGDATLVFENGAIGTVHARDKNYYAFSFDIIGSEGAIRLGNEIPARIFKPGDSRACTDFSVLHPEPLKTSLQRRSTPQVDELVNGILRGERSKSSLAEGAKALEIALAIHASHRRGRRIALPLDDPTLRVSSR